MSWHCAFCGKSCNGIIHDFHIGGGIPIKFVCHLKCLANKMGEYTEDLQEQLIDMENENEQSDEDK